MHRFLFAAFCLSGTAWRAPFTWRCRSTETTLLLPLSGRLLPALWRRRFSTCDFDFQITLFWTYDDFLLLLIRNWFNELSDFNILCGDRKRQPGHICIISRVMCMSARNIVAPKLSILLIIECEDEIVANLLFLEVSAKVTLALAIAFLKNMLQLSLREYVLILSLSFIHYVLCQNFGIINYWKSFCPFVCEFLKGCR